MKTLSSTPDFLSRFIALGSFPQDQFLPRPTFAGAVAEAFTQAMLEAYPGLKADLPHAQIAAALPVADAQPAPAPAPPTSWRLIAPSTLLTQGFIDQRTLNLSADRYRLTLDQKVENPAPLSVSMATLEQLFNEWAPQVIDVFAQALIHFWSTPSPAGVSPWLWLSRVLQVGLSATQNDTHRQPALTQEQSAGLGALSGFADKDQRLKLTTETPLHAYLVNIDTTDAQGPRRLQIPGLALITRSIGERLIVMAWSLADGLELFDSLQNFAQSLPRRLPGRADDSPVVWSAYEPEGHFFQALAQTLLDKTLYTLTALGQTARAERWSAARLALALDEEALMFHFFSAQESKDFEQLFSKLPQWLTTASRADIRAYSRLLANQVAQQQVAEGKTFLDDIPTLLDFALQTLNTRMQQDHPNDPVDAARIDIHDIAIQDLQMAWLTEDVMPLAEFSLTYVGGKPAAFIQVKERSGLPLPTWLNASYIKSLLEEIDIGSLYISLLKANLVDDAEQVTKRKALFKSQLQAQLPLLALEHKIRDTCGFTEAGWHLVARLMRSDAVPQNNQDCIRPLAFTLYDGAGVDIVGNMFVLGPRDLSSGPLVLYRPFATDSLLEFADREALMKAIQQPGELQDLVVAWLPDSVRSYYADGGFERPHLESVVNAGLLALLPRSPAQLADLIIKDDALAYVFDSHVEALITLSDKQTVSSSERRWILFKRYAWMLFNGLTFFVSGPLQKAAWVFQTLVSIDETLQARIESDPEAAKQSVISLLLNLSQTLLYEGLSFHAALNVHSRLQAPPDLPMPAPLELPAQSALKPPAPSTPAQAVSRKTGPDPDAQAVRAYSALDFSWFNAQPRPSASQRAALDTFISDLDVSSGTTIEVGPLKGLINFENNTYAVIDRKTYRVSRQDDGVVIQDAKKPIRFGPWLMSDDAGHWDFDLRLKLRGGGPKKRIAVMREEKKQALMQLVAEEARLMTEKLTRDRVLTLTEKLMATPTGRQTTFFERYETEFAEWRVSARALINTLQKMNDITPVPSFEAKMQGLWAELTLKLFKMQNFLEEQRKELPLATFSAEFKIRLSYAINQLASDNQQPYLEIIEHLKKAELLEHKAFDIALMESEGIEETSKLPIPRDSPLADLFLKRDKHFFDRHWAVIYMETLLELVLNRAASDLNAEEMHAFNHLNSDAFVNMGWSQLRLRLQGGEASVEHIEFYESAITLYQSLTATCENLIALKSEHFRNEYLPSLVASIKPLQMFAEMQLSKVIWESESSSSESDEPQPGPSWKTALPPTKPKAGALRQKVFKTTEKQVLVGVVREPSPDDPTEIVDVVDAFSQMKVSSYRRGASDEWEQIENLRPATPSAVSHAKSLSRLEADAIKLLGRVEASIQQARAFAKTSKIPVEIEEILEFKSQSLDETAKQMQGLLSAEGPDVEPLSRSQRGIANGLVAQLELNSVRLRAEGKRLRISLITDLPPTAAHIDYLKDQGQVDIVRRGRRRPLSGPRKDYMQEYEIRSRDGKALWYAHFHYDSPQAAPTAFTAAHLKTEAQRFMSAQALYAQAGSTTAVIQIYRSKINLALAEKLFLSVQ